MGIKQGMQAFAIKQALSYVDKDPEANLPKLLALADKFPGAKYFPGPLEFAHKILADKNNNWYRFAMSFWSDIDDGVRKKIFENFIINSNLLGWPLMEETRKKYGCSVPWAILMDLTSACNLHCVGCWAADYGKNMSMEYETLDSIINQANAMGTYMFLYTGGEPLVRKADIIKLCEAHQDCVFLSFTNGTLIDEAFADEMLRVKNFIPAISVEGFEEATDARRGKGTYQAVVRATEILKRKKLLFGTSCCYTSANAEVIGSEEYFDQMVKWGSKFCWLFTYMPVGAGAKPDLLATAEQREFMYHQVRKFRQTKPIFALDFWNDGEYVNGCIAGGRRYLHINANGDIEPCAFIHYSDSNIHEKTLLEAYCSPLFMEYHNNQPFNKNMLRPCPALDNPARLSQMVNASGAHSTDLASPEKAEEFCGKCVEAAKNWKPAADKLWSESHKV